MVAVADSGHGMSSRAAVSAFEPYFSTKETGVGLGLALVRRILEGHGGHVALESSPGLGTTVRLVLPVREATEAAPVAPSEARA